MAERFGEQGRREKHCCFCECIGENLHQATAPADHAPVLRACSEWEYQKQVTDLGYGRIGDQQFQSRLTQSKDTAHDNRCRAESAEDCSYLARGKGRKYIKP